MTKLEFIEATKGVKAMAEIQYTHTQGYTIGGLASQQGMQTPLQYSQIQQTSPYYYPSLPGPGPTQLTTFKYKVTFIFRDRVLNEDKEFILNYRFDNSNCLNGLVGLCTPDGISHYFSVSALAEVTVEELKEEVIQDEPKQP